MLVWVHGGDGDDSVKWVAGGRFDGGAGNDAVTVSVRNGTFAGGAGDDTAMEMSGGPYDGGDGTDSVTEYVIGSMVNVEVCSATVGAACP